jgi:hypothetical protein
MIKTALQRLNDKIDQLTMEICMIKIDVNSNYGHLTNEQIDKMVELRSLCKNDLKNLHLRKQRLEKLNKIYGYS